jgi:hypothetical protein
MAKVKKVLTPGSYTMKGKDTSTPKGKRKKTGRPASLKKAKRAKLKHREKYREQDMLEAIRLVQQEDYSISRAALFINAVKENIVPRMSLSDRLRKGLAKTPLLGRPQEWVAQYRYHYCFCF